VQEIAAREGALREKLSLASTRHQIVEAVAVLRDVRHALERQRAICSARRNRAAPHPCSRRLLAVGYLRLPRRARSTCGLYGRAGLSGRSRPDRGEHGRGDSPPRATHRSRHQRRKWLVPTQAEPAVCTVQCDLRLQSRMDDEGTAGESLSFWLRPGLMTCARLQSDDACL
jgi:hypothetical protein